MEIQEKDHLIKPGMVVVDLGAAPGGWSEYAMKQVGNRMNTSKLTLTPAL